MSESPSAGTWNLIAGHPGRTADARSAALRVFVPEDGDAAALTPFLLAVAADPTEEDLVRIEAIRVLPIAGVPEGEAAAAVRAALVRLAAEDEDFDVRNAAGSTVFELPGAEEDVARMRAVIAGEPEEFVRANLEAALRLFLDRKSRNGVEDLPR